jgi:predicted PilT family ATPase
MPTSKKKRKNGKIKKSVQKDFAGNPVRARDLKHTRSTRISQMLRIQTLGSACESLTSVEIQSAIDSGKGHELSYISTKLDENGVPVEGDTKTIKISNVDLVRLEAIHRTKVQSEEMMKENQENKV